MKDPQFLFYGRNVKRNPQTLKELSQVLYQKQVFINTKKELFSVPKAELGPVLPETPLSKRSKSSFLFSAIFHIYIFVGSFSWHYVANPMHFNCNKAKENENIGLSNGHTSGQTH